MWMLAPDPDETKEAWVGKLTFPTNSAEYFGFELIRNVDDADAYRDKPFDQDYVIGLLDHQQKCTLIKPIIKELSPGSIGAHYNFQRTIVEGQFQSILRGLPIEDGELKQFRGLSFNSNAVNTWFRRRPFDVKHDPKSGKQEVEIKNPEVMKFDIANFGNVELTSRTNILSDRNNKSLHPTSNMKITFSDEKSLEEVLSYSIRLNALFGFLVGCPMKPPLFKAWLSKTYNLGTHQLHHEGELEIGGVRWTDKTFLHPMDCIHSYGWGGVELQKIMENFLSNSDDFMNRIYAVEFSRFYTKDLNAKFAVAMPAFEQYLKAQFTTKEESAFAKNEKDFFAWVDLSNNEHIIEFWKKHLNVVKRKSTSLPIVISRAIDDLNKKGFRFPQTLSKDINNRRAAVFHSVPNMSTEEIYKYFAEIEAIDGMLMLFTLKDLGVDIGYLSEHYHALSHMQRYLKKREIPTYIPPAMLRKSNIQEETNELTHDDLYGPL